MSPGIRVGCVLIVAAAVAAAAGCNTREHDNPFDPENPETGGAPRNLAAIAGDGSVELRINPLGITDVTAYRVWRWTGAESTLIGDSLLAPGTQVLEDGTAVNGITYVYAVDVFTSSEGEPIRGRSDTATPGPNRPWVIDGGFPPLAVLSADGRRVRGRFGLGGPYAGVWVDSSDGGIWASEEFDARLWHFDQNGAVISVRGDLAPVYRLAAGPRGTFWALSRLDRVLYRLDGAGSVVDTNMIGGNGDLRDLDSDPGDFSAWVTDASGVIRHYGPGGELSFLSTGSSAYSAALDPGQRGVWVTDRANRVVSFFRASPSAWSQTVVGGFGGTPQEITACVGPGLEIRAWVADAGGSLALIEVNPDVEPPSGYVVQRVEDIVTPRAPLAGPDGSCYLFETGTATLLRVSPDGATTERLAELVSPRLIDVWWRD